MENIIFYRPPTRHLHPIDWRPLERDMTAHRHACVAVEDFDGDYYFDWKNGPLVRFVFMRGSIWRVEINFLGASIFARQSSNKSFGRVALQAHIMSCLIKCDEVFNICPHLTFWKGYRRRSRRWLSFIYLSLWIFINICPRKIIVITIHPSSWKINDDDINLLIWP